MKQRICKKNLLCALIVSLSCALTIFFFPPSDTMLGNADEFPVGPENVMIPMFVVAIIVAVLIFILLFICILINQKLFNSIVCLVFGIELATYFQVLFWNGEMVLANESPEKYEERNIHNYLNFIMYYATAVVPIILYYAKLSYKAKFYKLITRSNLCIAAAIIIAMQSVGIGSSLLSVHSVNSKPTVKYLSFEPTTSLSKEKNIIVFVVDRMDGGWMADMEERYPELYDEMDGFTLYHDNLSKYGQTFPAVANLLTGREYGREGRYLYLTNSFAGRNPLDELRDNGFVSNFLTECPNAFNNIVNLNDHCDNIKESEMECCIDYYSDYGIIYTMTLLSFSKCLPYFMKCLATESIEPDFTNFFVYLKDENGKIDIEDKMDYTITPGNDMRYYKYINAHLLDADNENKVFNFIHFAGFHDDSREVSELYEGYDGGRVNYYTTARGEFEIINNYMEQMKKLGVYDNSTIIILGDHGKQIASVTKGYKLVEPITTGLMIKPENSHGRMQDDYTSQLSHKYFQASVLEYAGIDHSNYGYSYNDIIDGNISAVREMSLESSCPADYEVKGRADDFSNWKCVYFKEKKRHG